MRLAPVRTGLLAALLLISAAGSAAEPAPGATPAAAAAGLRGRTVVEVAVEGLVTVDVEAVRQVMATRRGAPFHPSTYADDFGRVFGTGLFESVKLGAPEPSGDGVRVNVVCRERPLIDAIQVRGNLRVRTRELLKAARGGLASASTETAPGSVSRTSVSVARPSLAVGGRYDPFVAHEMAASIKTLYVDKRFPLAEIQFRAEPVPGRPGRVTVVFEVEEDGLVKIGEVIFRGQSALPRKKLLRVIQSRPGGFLRQAGRYSPEKLADDAVQIQMLYRNSGYSDARVAVLPAEIGPPRGRRGRRIAKVIFEVREGRFYVYGPVTFKGLESVGEEAALKRAGLQPGKPWSDEEVAAAAARIRALLGETGRPFCQVGPRRVATAQDGVVGVEFRVSEGPQAGVGEVRIRGNARTRDRVIRRELELLPGDMFDSRKLNDSRNRLRSTGIFSRVQLTPVPGEDPDTADIEVEVEETRTGFIQIGASVSPDDGSVGGGFSINENNFDWQRLPSSWDDFVDGGAFRGGAQRLGFRANFTASQKVFSLDYANPWIWDTPARYSLGGSLYLTDKDLENYQERRLGLRARLGRIVFTRRLRAGLTYSVQDVFIDHIDSDLPAEVLVDDGRSVLSSMELLLAWDGRDNRLIPTRGLLLEASEEVFGGVLGGDWDMRKTSVRGHLFAPLFRIAEYPAVLHLFARADWANPFGDNERVPVYERFYAGGIGTVRGFDYRSIGPQVDGEPIGGCFRATQSAELIFPLYQNTLRGVVFFDAGMVWPEEGDFELHDQKRSVGVGVHVHAAQFFGQTPIKLYFSRAINPDEDDDTRLFQMSFSLLF